MPDDPSREKPSFLLSVLAVFLISAGVIALQLALMRCLSISRWHHFSYLVISTALLGFGASGTLLAFVGEWLRRRFTVASTVATVLFALSVTLSFRAAEALPLDPRYVLYSGRQAALMFLYHVLLLIPFLLAATVIGLSLTHFTGRVHLVYGANLVGAGLGGAVAIGLMFLLPPVRLLHVVAAMGVAAALLWSLSSGRRRRRGLLVLVVLVAGGAVAAEAVRKPLVLRVDQYKALSIMRQWEAQGDARRVLTRFSPRARLDVYDSPAQHHTLFVSLTATSLPPPQLSMLADGNSAGTVFKIRSAEEAEILDFTLMSVPYRLVSRPRVLLLGEAGGMNVWLARRMGAEHVTVVQPNPQIVAIMRGPLAEMGGEVFSGPDVQVVVSQPRAFLERSRERFDIVQIVTAEGVAAGVSGLRSLHEDFLLTREGLALCINHLTEGGVLAATRGRQLPPRDNVKLFATMCAALEDLGYADPGRQMVQLRDHQAAATLAFRTPVSSERCGLLKSDAARLALDIEWSPCSGVRYDEQTHQVEGPEGEPYSYFHHAAVEILSERREAFFRDWVYNVRPATDSSPYFYDFFRWKSLPRFVESYGHEWLRRLELGYVVLVFALVQAVVVGGVLILLPLLRLRRGRGVSGGRAVTGAYFLLLGLGYLMLEIVFLLKFTHFLGDPIYAAAGVIGAFLVFSGLGSVSSRRLCPSPQRAICVAALGIAVMATLYAAGLDPVCRALIGWPLPARVLASALLTAPLAFLMGWPFPNGLTLVQRANPPLVPWAWGMNGFASVAASPLAVIIAISAGFNTVLLVASALYVTAAAVSFALRERCAAEVGRRLET